jgi:hypothetical protein
MMMTTVAWDSRLSSRATAFASTRGKACEQQRKRGYASVPPSSLPCTDGALLLLRACRWWRALSSLLPFFFSYTHTHAHAWTLEQEGLCMRGRMETHLRCATRSAGVRCVCVWRLTIICGALSLSLSLWCKETVQRVGWGWGWGMADVDGVGQGTGTRPGDCALPHSFPAPPTANK